MGLFRKTPGSDWADNLAKSQLIHADCLVLLQQWIATTDELVFEKSISTYQKTMSNKNIAIGQMIVKHQMARDFLAESFVTTGKPNIGSRNPDRYTVGTINQMSISELLLGAFYSQIIYIGAFLYCEEKQLEIENFDPAATAKYDVNMLVETILMEFQFIRDLFDPNASFKDSNLAFDSSSNFDRMIIQHANEMKDIPWGMSKVNDEKEAKCGSLLGWIGGVDDSYTLNSFSFSY